MSVKWRWMKLVIRRRHFRLQVQSGGVGCLAHRGYCA
jgi:hypothetical protein